MSRVPARDPWQYAARRCRWFLPGSLPPPGRQVVSALVLGSRGTGTHLLGPSTGGSEYRGGRDGRYLVLGIGWYPLSFRQGVTNPHPSTKIPPLHSATSNRVPLVPGYHREPPEYQIQRSCGHETSQRKNVSGDAHVTPLPADQCGTRRCRPGESPQPRAGRESTGARCFVHHRRQRRDCSDS